MSGEKKGFFKVFLFFEKILDTCWKDVEWERSLGWFNSTRYESNLEIHNDNLTMRLFTISSDSCV